MSYWSAKQISTGFVRYELYGRQNLLALCKQVGSDVLRPQHAVSQTWEMSQTQPTFKEKDKKTFFCSKCTCFCCLWNVVANRTIKPVLSDCKILFPQYSVGFCCIILSLKYEQSNYQRWQIQERKSGWDEFHNVYAKWVWDFGFCLWCCGNVCMCVINDRPVFH